MTVLRVKINNNNKNNKTVLSFLFETRLAAGLCLDGGPSGGAYINLSLNSYIMKLKDGENTEKEGEGKCRERGREGRGKGTFASS